MMLTGMPLERILSMDLMTFNAMLPIINRVVYRNKAEDLFSTFMAVNGGMAGKDEGVRNLMDNWLAATGVDRTELAASGKRTGADFLKDFKVGSGGKI